MTCRRIGIPVCLVIRRLKGLNKSHRLRQALASHREFTEQDRHGCCLPGAYSLGGKTANEQLGECEFITIVVSPMTYRALLNFILGKRGEG